MSIEDQLLDGPAAEAPLVVGPRLPPRRDWRDWLSALSSYLPLILMALLALGTWWVVRHSPLPAAPRVAGPARHIPDYTMDRFMVQRYARGGELLAQIEGERMRHFPDTDTVEIDEVRVRSTSPEGVVTVATARRAETNGQGTEVRLQGGAQVVREAPPRGGAPLVFKGEFLQAFLDTERVRSHLPVEVTQGGMRMRADGLEYDNVAKVLRLKGRVQAVFPARGR